MKIGCSMPKINKEIRVKSELANVKGLSREVLKALDRFKLDQKTLSDIKLAIEEALINAITHGNKSHPDSEVGLSYRIDSKKASIIIKDQGKGFDYHKIPKVVKNRDISKTSGRGIFLITHVMDEVRFNESGNQITMVKYLRGRSVFPDPSSRGTK